MELSKEKICQDIEEIREVIECTKTTYAGDRKSVV